jgi:hypothetical protein
MRFPFKKAFLINSEFDSIFKGIDKNHRTASTPLFPKKEDCRGK